MGKRTDKSTLLIHGSEALGSVPLRPCPNAFQDNLAKYGRSFSSESLIVTARKG